MAATNSRRAAWLDFMAETAVPAADVEGYRPMLDLLAKLVDPKWLKPLSRGTFIAFAALGAATLPLTWFAAKGAYDEFKSTQSDIKKILNSLNDVTTNLKIAAEHNAGVDHRLDSVEFINQGQGDTLSRQGERLSTLEGMIYPAAPSYRR